MRAIKGINQRIGANMREVREENRYTQEQLSEILGVTPNHLSAVERGISGASLELIEKFCQIFGISADRLFFEQPQIDSLTAELIRKLGSVSPDQRPQVRKILSGIMELIENH